MKTARIYIIVILAIIAWATPARGQQLDYPLDTINGQVYYRYTVERSVGLYRISVNFGVTQEEILKANPHLKYQGLRYDEVLLIPVKGAKVVQQKEKKKNRFSLFDEPKPVEKPVEERVEKPVEDPVVEQEVVMQAIDTILVDTMLVDTVAMDTLPVLDSTAIQLAFLLPLHADAIKRDKNMERFYDFYAGSLIAIYEAQAKGQQLEVFTYDIGKTANRTKEVLQEHPEIRTVDAVVGPAYSQQVAIVVDSLQQDSVWTLIPFLPRMDNLSDYPYVLKFNPSEQIEADTIARYLAQKGDSINCVLVEAKEGDVIPSTIKALHEALEREQVPTSTISLRALLIDSVDGSFRDSVENIVIFNTERYSNLQTVMPHLLQAATMYRITLYSHYSWQNENIVLPQLYASVFEREPVVPDSYQALFDTYFAHELSSTLPRYDLLGYDLTSQLLHTLRHQADTTVQADSINVFGDMLWEGVQADIRYQQSAPQSGYENYIMHIIHQ